MRVSIFGLGYVGSVTAGCLTRDGHSIIGVDVVEGKVEQLARGESTVIEPGLDAILTEAHRAGRLTATTDVHHAIEHTDASIICVGTPSRRDGSHDLKYLEKTVRSIGRALIGRRRHHTVIVRSTVEPGTCDSLVLPVLMAESGLDQERLSVVVVPEFLREATAVQDYEDPPFVVVGSLSGRPDGSERTVDALFGRFGDRVVWTDIRQAELLKALCNVFHALKVTFANEVGRLSDALDIDGAGLMNLLCKDTKLNISPAYLRPGLPFGGSCLPKDLRSVLSLARRHSIELPMLTGVLPSNHEHKRVMIETVEDAPPCRIGMDGLAFKAGTDDLRESPMVHLAEYLIGKGYDLKILDPAVSVSKLNGSNAKFGHQHVSHLSDRLVDVGALLEHAEVLILTRHNTELRRRALKRPNPPRVIDLARHAPDRKATSGALTAHVVDFAYDRKLAS